MAFLGGAECSTAGNPLSQFTKHVQDDKSLQRDRFVGAGPSGLQESFRTPRNGASQEAAIQDFLQDGDQLPPDISQPFVMEQMRRDLDGYRISSPSVASPAWAQEFDPSERARMEAAFRAPKAGSFLPAGLSPAEFQRFRQSEWSQSPRLSSPSMQTNGYSPTRGWGYGANRIASMGPYDRGSAIQRRQGEPLVQSKAKGRMVELDDQDWEQQFAEFDQAGKLQEQDLDTDVNAAMEAELNDMDRSVPLTESNEYGDFESVWRGIQAENAEYASKMLNDDSLSNFDFDKFLQDDPGAWDSFDGNFRDPHLGDYLFEDSNIFSSAKDPYDEGTRIMREAGNLSLAALAFEAAVQKDPQHLLAWVALGNAQAQNEKETPAIRALEQAIHIDPNNLPALMGLAISYTNEGYDSTAYRTLERWLSIKYPSVLPPDEISAPQEMGFTERHLLHEKVTEYFIRAAQLSPQGEHMDPDVQVGLGVLFYGAEQYAKAVDCFEAALASSEQGHSNHRDQAHLLWNRLGATLANSGRSEEAIQAYEKALQLNPNFVRARYNLGVSCINIGCNEEAAQHLLGALAMHGVVEREGVQRVREVMGEDISNGDIGRDLSEGDVRRMASMNQSTNLIETLRRVFGNMGRKDLAERVQIARSKLQGLPISQLQRRFASEEAQTQSEPSADRTEEGQHGDNSIAKSSQHSSQEALSKPTEAAANITPAVDDPAPEQASSSPPAQSGESRTVGELASAAAETTREAASNAYEALAGLPGTGDRNLTLTRPEVPPSTTVYVGNLFFDVREEDLRREFEKLGAIESVKLILDNRGLSKGFGYINFTDIATATSAIENYNNQPFEGRRLSVQFAAQRTTGATRNHTLSPPSRTLFVGNMSYDMSDRELNNLFREIRNVIDVRVAIDRRTGQPRGFAHADFTDVESAKEAMVVLSGKEVCGRPLRVDYSQGHVRSERQTEQRAENRQQGY
ncbi:MAG: hypothetical protein Q9177_003868 [Variospora cf. flavescens]